MQWIFLIAGIAMLFVLKRKTHTPNVFSPEIPDGTLHEHMLAAAREANGSSFHRIRLQKRHLSQLEKSIRYLSRFPDDESLPAARVLCRHSRFLQMEFIHALQIQKQTPKHPSSPQKLIRAKSFAHELLLHCEGSFDSGSFTAGLSAWQSIQPMTEGELTALPLVFRICILEWIHQLSQQCEMDQRARSDARRVLLFHKRKKTHAVQKLLLRNIQSASFWEMLWRMEKPSEWMERSLSQKPDSADILVPAEHLAQARRHLFCSNLVAALKAVERFPWQRVLEEASTIHLAFQQDDIYRQMDADSRALYRKKAAHIAKNLRLSEKAVSGEVLALAKKAGRDAVAGHVGFYLLDDGYPELLAHLNKKTFFRRISLFAAGHTHTLFSVISFCVFFLLLATGFRWNLPLLLLVPFAAVYLYAVQQFILRLPNARPSSAALPRIALKSLSDSEQTLVVCHAVLHSSEQALACVKQLSIMHEGDPDAHLHFMLLADFQDSLTATLSTDPQIIAAASCAIEALCSGTGHPFFYLQRERIYSPSEKGYCSRERKHGALETLLCLIRGHAVQDHFAYESVDPAWLKGKYRYVISLDEQTVLPPGSAKQLIGTMLHPLHVRQTRNHRVRGFSVLQPRIKAPLHTVTTQLGKLLGSAEPYNSSHSAEQSVFFRHPSFLGTGIIDPEPFLNATLHVLPPGRFLSPHFLEASLAGCGYAGDVPLFEARPQTLKRMLNRLHQTTRSSWQMAPGLIPRLGYAGRAKPTGPERLILWQRLLQSLIAPMRMLLLIYAAFTGRAGLLAALAVLPDFALLFSRAGRTLSGFLCKLALLPCEAYLQADAIARTLYRVLLSRQHLQASSPDDRLSLGSEQPSMLFFILNMSCAGLFASLALLSSGYALLPLALLWAAFPFALPYLEQERSAPQPLTSYMKEVLLRLAKNTFTFFDTIVTPDDHSLPVESIQIEPLKEIRRRTSPGAIGLYLCSLVAAEKMHLITVKSMALRMSETVSALEKLPKWHGLFFNCYDTATLAVHSPAVISSADCGLLAVCLLTSAQGVRAILAELEPDEQNLANRLDQLSSSMQLFRLYDPEAGLFRTDVDPSNPSAFSEHHDMLASQSRLLSYAAIMLHQVPPDHWQHLRRAQSSGGALLSQNGSMASYQLPLLFQPLIPDTMLERSSRSALRLQRRHRLGGAFGVSDSEYFAFDQMQYYLFGSFGMTALSLDPETESSVLSPFSSALCASLDAKAFFRNYQKLQRLGLEGPLGLFEAADFSADRTGEKKMRIVRSHRSAHQGMILCALCNVLSDGYIASLFSNLPRALACQHLLEEPFIRRHTIKRRPLRLSNGRSGRNDDVLRHEAHRLAFPAEAHLLHGGETSMLMDAQGNSVLLSNSAVITRRHKERWQPSGIQLYIKDSHSGVFWLPTDPHLTHSVRFETAQTVFAAAHADVRSELRIWINPLDGSCIQCLKIENAAPKERLMEVCSCVEPAFPNPENGKDDHHPFLQTKQLGSRCVSGVYRSKSPDTPCRRVRHALSTQTPIHALRIQTDRSAFIGRGRTLHSPRAMEMPISAIEDSLGEMTDPCLSLRAQFLLLPQETQMFFLITCCDDRPDNAVSFAERLSHPHRLLRSYDSALTRSIAASRYLDLPADAMKTIFHLLGVLLHADRPLCQNHADSHLPIHKLNRCQLTGDAPILLYICSGSLNEPVFELLLSAFAFFRLNGLKMDFVILAEESRSSEVLAEAEAFIQDTHCAEWINQPHGIHLASAASEEEKTLLRRAAHLTLTAGGGTIEQQLNPISGVVRARPVYTNHANDRWEQTLHDADGLMFENGLGGFTKETGDYQITLQPGMQTPGPWRNALCNGRFCTMACESGLLFSLPADAAGFAHSTDSLFPYGNEHFFLRDQEQQLLWSITRLPLGQDTTVRVTHAPGVTTYESSGYGMMIRMQCFTDERFPMGIRIVHLHNDTSSERTLTLFHTCRFSDWLPVSVKCENDRVWCSFSGADKRAGLCAIDADEVTSASMDNGLFQGLWGPLPYALSVMDDLPQDSGDTAILAYSVRLKPAERRMIASALICAENEAHWNRMISHVREGSATDRLHAVRRMWEERLGILQFDLPDPALSLFSGRWLPYQVQTALMQPDENHSGLLFSLPLSVLREEYKKSLLDHALSITKCTSLAERLFFVYVLAAYAESSGEDELLNESLFASSGDHSTTLLEICLQIIDAVSFGAHNLPVDGQIESVWLGMLLCEIIRCLAPVCESKTQRFLEEKRAALYTALERFAWDGAWYLYGWDSTGRKIGSNEAKEEKIFLLPQSMAVICGVSRDRCTIAMENAWQLLYDRDDGLLRMAAPQNQNTNHSVQNTIAACMTVSALHQLGQSERAWELARALLPTAHTSSHQQAESYRAEPYWMPSEILALPKQPVQSLSAVNAQGAACFLKVLTEQLLGLHKSKDGLRFRPVVPSSWTQLRITFHFGGSTYHLHALRTCSQPEADGKPLDDAVLKLIDDGKTHEAFFPLR